LPDKQASPPQLSWAIYLARSKPAKWLGTVEAADADEAIEAATREFAVKDSGQVIVVLAAVARWRGLSAEAQDHGAVRAAGPLTGPRRRSNGEIPQTASWHPVQPAAPMD